MPSPEASRRNLEQARSLGRVIYWRRPSESQQIKGDIARLHHARPGLSQRTIARILHVSQPYVARVLKRLRRATSIEDAIGPEAYRHYRERMEMERRAHFARQTGAPLSLIGESAHESGPAFDEPKASGPIATVPTVEAHGTEYVERLRSTDGEVIEGWGSRPSCAQPAASVPAHTSQAASSLPRVQADLSHVDAPILEYIGFNPNRPKTWF